MDMTPTIHSPNQNDAPKDEDEFPSNEFVPVNNFESETSSDEEELIDGNGYQLLPQCTENEEEQGAGDEFSPNTEEEESSENPYVHILFLQNLNVSSHTEEASATEVEEVESSPLDQDKIEEIKTAMAGFTLPNSSIPDWALHIPEEDWNAELASRIKRKAELKSDNSTEK